MAAVLRWAALTALYLALVGQVPIAEVVAGLLSGLAAMLLSWALRAMAERPFALRAPWHRLVPRLALSLARDAARVAIALAKAIPAGGTGESLRQPFAADGDGAAGAGHRALAVLLASLAPNGYVIETGKRALQLHRLAPAAPSADPQWPL